jgi:threonine dehydrogenase-like Zn-dependent dehydrogenase
VVFIETTGSAAVLQNILDVIPPHASLILAGAGDGDVTAINVYADVHKKNIRIIGAAGGLDPQRALRAERLLQHRLKPRPLPRIAAANGATPALPTAGVVFTWET